MEKSSEAYFEINNDLKPLGPSTLEIHPPCNATRLGKLRPAPTPELSDAPYGSIIALERNPHLQQVASVSRGILAPLAPLFLF